MNFVFGGSFLLIEEKSLVFREGELFFVGERKGRGGMEKSEREKGEKQEKKERERKEKEKEKKEKEREKKEREEGDQWER